METDDPRAALADGDVKTRSAAARDLALIGTLEDLEPLVKLAQGDKSSAVRLYAAAAAADIASRFRDGGLDAGVRGKIEEWVGRADPAIHPSLLMLFAPFPEKTVISRLLRMLRDPRNEVRAGAAVALRRLALSSAALELPMLEAMVGDLLKRKLTPDVNFELAKMAGELGWTHLDDLLRKLRPYTEQLSEAVDEAIKRNRARRELETYDGYWVDQGLDVQQAGTPQPVGYLAISAGSAVDESGTKGGLTIGDEGSLTVRGAPARLLWAAPPGLFHERVAVIQTAERAWWRQEGKALVELLDSGSDLAPEAYAAMGTELESLEGAAGKRARMIAAWGAGDMEVAKEAIDDFTSKKKPRIDLWYWRARIDADLGDKEGARDAIERFLSKAKNKAPLRALGEALRDELG